MPAVLEDPKHGTHGFVKGELISEAYLYFSSILKVQLDSANDALCSYWSKTIRAGFGSGPKLFGTCL
jgi:hypothetical protein